MNVKSAIANFQLLVICYAKELKNTLMLLCSTSAKNVGNNFHEKTIVIGMSQEKKSTVDKHFVQCLLQFYHRTSECLETFTVRVFTPEASERKFQRKMEEMEKNKEVKYGEMIIKVKQNLNLFWYYFTITFHLFLIHFQQKTYKSKLGFATFNRFTNFFFVF